MYVHLQAAHELKHMVSYIHMRECDSVCGTPKNILWSVLLERLYLATICGHQTVWDYFKRTNKYEIYI